MKKAMCIAATAILILSLAGCAETAGPAPLGTNAAPMVNEETSQESTDAQDSAAALFSDSKEVTSAPETEKAAEEPTAETTPDSGTSTEAPKETTEPQETAAPSKATETPQPEKPAIISVNENGSAVCMTDLPFGSYYLKELSTDSHYILSDEKYPVVFEYAGQDTALVEIKANEGKAIDNDLIYGEIHGLKKDEDGNALAGALIGLFRADETDYTAENALMTATSAEDGSFYFSSAWTTIWS